MWKPHPDVEAGLRAGAIPEDQAHELANVILTEVSANNALDAASQVWTMTSTLGFEALVRGLPVHCLGMPFYAGWGLTQDRHPAPAHRTARPTLQGLVHACLIGYPRYFHPETGAAISVEQALTLLASGQSFVTTPGLRALVQRLVAAFRARQT
jgi:capsular polysaccharide export protein